MRGQSVRIEETKRVAPGQVRALFRAAGWDEDLARYSPRQVQALLRQSHRVLAAWCPTGTLVGFASAVSDGVLCAMVQNLLVHPDYRKRGVGTRLLRQLIRAYRRQGIPCVYVLGRRGRRARQFFARAGFQPLNWNVFAHLTK